MQLLDVVRSVIGHLHQPPSVSYYVLYARQYSVVNSYHPCWFEVI